MIFKIDGIEVTANNDDTIMEAARKAGILIPGLCYSEHVDGINCFFSS